MKTNDTRAIMQHLDELAETSRANKRELKAEYQAARAELEALEQQRQETESVAEYKRFSDLIHDKREYIDFLEHKEKTQSVEIMDRGELKSLQAALLDEVRELEQKTAPEIYNRLMELIRIFETYAQRVDELNEVYYKARSLAGLGGDFLDARLEDMQTDKYDWYYHFCKMCRNHHNEIRNAKKAGERLKNRTPWTAYDVKLKKYAD